MGLRLIFLRCRQEVVEAQGTSNIAVKMPLTELEEWYRELATVHHNDDYTESGSCVPSTWCRALVQ